MSGVFLITTLLKKKNTYNDLSLLTALSSSAGSFEFFPHPLLFLFLLLLCDIFGREAMKRKDNKYMYIQTLPKVRETGI